MLKWNGLLPLIKMLLVALAIGTLPITIPMLAEALTTEEQVNGYFFPAYRADVAHGLCFATIDSWVGSRLIRSLTLVPNVHCKEFQ